MIICRESDQKLIDKALPICLFHKWVPWDIWSWKKSELPLTNSTKLWNGISADWLLNGLAGFTGFFSTNQPSIITSAAIPVLQEAPPGMIGPGMSPWPVAAELVHVAEAAWGRPITILTLVHFCYALMDYFLWFLFEGFPYRTPARRVCCRSGLYHSEGSWTQTQGRPKRWRTCWRAAGPRRPGEWPRPGTRPAGAQQGRSFSVGWIVDKKLTGPSQFLGLFILCSLSLPESQFPTNCVWPASSI